MNYLDDKNYEDVSFIKKHPTIKGVIITLAVFIISFSSIGMYKLANPPKEEKRTAVPVELREVGKLVCAEKESVGKKDISEPVKLLNLLPLGYNSEMQFEYTALTSFYYDLDKAKATANELTKVVTVNAPKQEHETHLKQDSYEENFNRQSKLRPITEKEFNAKVVELEKELDELANSKDSQDKAKKSFEKRYTKMIHNLGSYKDYEVRFKYA